MHMRRVPIVVLLLLMSSSVLAEEPPATAPTVAAQIAGALAAAPEDRRADAKVLAVGPRGETTVLREGSNELICLADDPTDERFHSACYHVALEPWMARGRALRREGITGPDSLQRRHQEIERGELEMPASPTTVYNLGGPLEVFDPISGAIAGARWVWAIYTPYATAASTGLPTTPQAPGGPWIMRPGTPSSHIMVAQPPPRGAARQGN